MTSLNIDDAIWERIALGDKEAYAEAYRCYFQKFYNYGIKFSYDYTLIEDTVQETLLQIWENRQIISTIQYINTYYFSAFRNKLFGKIKQSQKQKTGYSTYEPEFSVEQVIIAQEIDEELKEKLHNAIADLTSRQREAIFLRFYEGLSFEEVAIVLGITTKATYKIVARAVEELRKLLVFDALLLVFLFSAQKI